MRFQVLPAISNAYRRFNSFLLPSVDITEAPWLLKPTTIERNLMKDFHVSNIRDLPVPLKFAAVSLTETGGTVNKIVAELRRASS